MSILNQSSNPIFVSYARGDAVDPFDPAMSFVTRLHRDLTARGFKVWFDRNAMPSRGLTFHQEIQDAVAARERLLLIVGPTAAVLDRSCIGFAGCWSDTANPLLAWLSLARHTLQ